LLGIVLPIGGVKEKVLGARRAGIKEVILPAENEPNVKEDLQPHMLEGMTIHYARTVDQVLELALEKTPVLPLPIEKRRLTTQPGPAVIPPVH
jgi:ATP-dependent Lon protease